MMIAVPLLKIFRELETMASQKLKVIMEPVIMFGHESASKPADLVSSFKHRSGVTVIVTDLRGTSPHLSSSLPQTKTVQSMVRSEKLDFLATVGPNQGENILDSASFPC